jgi:hypothetical protein
VSPPEASPRSLPSWPYSAQVVALSRGDPVHGNGIGAWGALAVTVAAPVVSRAATATPEATAAARRIGLNFCMALSEFNISVRAGRYADERGNRYLMAEVWAPGEGWSRFPVEA